MHWFKKTLAVVGIVTIALAVLAIVGWIAVMWVIGIPHII